MTSLSSQATTIVHRSAPPPSMTRMPCMHRCAPAARPHQRTHMTPQPTPAYAQVCAHSPTATRTIAAPEAGHHEAARPRLMSAGRHSRLTLDPPHTPITLQCIWMQLPDRNGWCRLQIVVVQQVPAATSLAGLACVGDACNRHANAREHLQARAVVAGRAGSFLVRPTASMSRCRCPPAPRPMPRRLQCCWSP